LPALRFTPADPTDIDFIDGLRRRDSSALGFLTRRAIDAKVRSGLVRVARRGEVPVGFVLHGSLAGPEVRVFQLAVAPAERGLGIGRLLVEELLRVAHKAGAAGVSLRCREALAANRFWHANGFKLHDLEQCSGSALYVWIRRLPDTTPPRDCPSFTFSTRWHRCPVCHTWTCGAWTPRGYRRSTCATCTPRTSTALRAR
jgi:GNAT superfamily N-acetyltransferase